MSINKNARFDFECLGCHHRFPITIKQVESKSVICPNCHRTIEIGGNLTKELEKMIEQARRDLENKAKRNFK